MVEKLLSRRKSHCWVVRVVLSLWDRAWSWRQVEAVGTKKFWELLCSRKLQKISGAQVCVLLLFVQGGGVGPHDYSSSCPTDP